MRLLLVNDDGICSEGIIVLAKTLAREHEVYVVAPNKENSGKSHAFTFGPLICEEVKLDDSFKAYSLTGTPVDCVKFGIDYVCSGLKPDMVISGINNEHNVGCTIMYSGTINAALVGVEYHIPAVALSVSKKGSDYVYPSEFFAKNIQTFYDFIVKKDIILSVNIPTAKKEEIKGVKFVRVGVSSYDDYYEYRKDLPSGEGYYVFGNFIVEDTPDRQTDCELIFDNYITISPLKIDLTDIERLKELQGLDIPL